jgi:hypothetical protein
MGKVLGSLILLVPLAGCTSVDMVQTGSVSTGQTNYADTGRPRSLNWARIGAVESGQGAPGDYGPVSPANVGQTGYLNDVYVNTPANHCHGIEWSWCAGGYQ